MKRTTRNLLFMTLFMLKFMIGSKHRLYAEPVRYLVKMKKNSGESLRAPPTFSASLLSVKSELERGAMRGHHVRSYQRVGIMVVDGEHGDIEPALKQNPLVEYYEQDRQWKPYAAASANEPSSQSMAPWLKDVMGLDESAPDPNVAYTGNSPVIVAVVDTGANINHPFLRAALSKNASEMSAGTHDSDDNGYTDDVFGANVFSKDGNVAETNTDHGTHVAGLVKIVRDQAIPKFPAAAAVQLMPVKFIDATGSGSTSAAIAALEYAASRGAKVVNASWGATGTGAFSQALYDSMLELYHQNIVIAAAAGNAENGVANDNDVNPAFPASFNIPGLISVASVTPSYRQSGGTPVMSAFTLSDFSNYGTSTVDIAAPGSYRDIYSDESGVYSANAWYPDNSLNLYIRMRGTSMASPLVAGVAAVVRAINPSLTAYEVKNLIVNNGRKSPTLAKIKSSASVDAMAAFQAAAATKSQGLQPEPSAEKFNLGSPLLGQAGGGGCGLILDVAAKRGGKGPGSEGPLGGNSLGIFTAIYALMALSRRIKRGHFLTLSV